MTKLADMTKLTSIDLNPQPRVWPACAECLEPFVLRRAIVFKQARTRHTGHTASTIDFEWCWQRDCKHRKAEAITQISKPTKKRKARR